MEAEHIIEFMTINIALVAYIALVRYRYIDKKKNIAFLMIPELFFILSGVIFFYNYWDYFKRNSLVIGSEKQLEASQVTCLTTELGLIIFAFGIIIMVILHFIEWIRVLNQ